jgi:lysozyme family protein
VPVNPQPPHADGTVAHPYSALNLRLALAAIGMLASGVAAVLAWRGGYMAVAWAAVGLAAVGVVDVVVIQLRRRARHRANHSHHSLFE